MATITEAATFAPLVQLWQTPMKPDNTPVRSGSPIGRITWFSSFNTAAKDAGNVVELAIACTMPTRQFAYRLMNAQWQAEITDAGAPADINDWSNQALLTIPADLDLISINLSKANIATQATITNLFASNLFVPSLGGNVEGAAGGISFRDPFTPLSPMIFRIVNLSGNAGAVTTWFSHMWAFVYTIEQYNQGAMWTSVPIGGGT